MNEMKRMRGDDDAVDRSNMLTCLRRWWMMVVVVGEGRMMRQLGVGQSGWAVQRMFAAQQQRNQGSPV